MSVQSQDNSDKALDTPSSTISKLSSDSRESATLVAPVEDVKKPDVEAKKTPPPPKEVVAEKEKEKEHPEVEKKVIKIFC